MRGGDQVSLDGAEGHHAAVVRRVGVGERVDLTDGAGHVARCIVIAADRRGLTCEIQDRFDVPAPQPRLVAVQAVPKGERGEIAVETMTEVGVDEIVPWSAARCVVRWKAERATKALGRWRSTAREAAKQSRRAWLPQVGELASTRQVADRLREAALAVVLHEEASVGLGAIDLPDTGDVVVVIGPEGGVAPDELDTFAAAGAVAARLGPTVLRTSTAGTVAAGILLSRTRRWTPPLP
ncbi:16S rRNA (uracil(1498)-N(3))-methyltransferase [Phytoactinopolyspora limicola]|uniref:16S rRNA (uracil(1498)-N(3))-methyltransferase n=1 Tax=Phytoactinopolyspora limicola TaxID=2715536 RepID=UPI001B7D7684